MWPVRILSLHVKTGIRLEAAVDSEKLADFVEEAGSKSINRAHFEAVHKERTMMNDECVCVCETLINDNPIDFINICQYFFA